MAPFFTSGDSSLRSASSFCRGVVLQSLTTITPSTPSPAHPPNALRRDQLGDPRASSTRENYGSPFRSLLCPSCFMFFLAPAFRGLPTIYRRFHTLPPFHNMNRSIRSPSPARPPRIWHFASDRAKRIDGARLSPAFFSIVVVPRSLPGMIRPRTRVNPISPPFLPTEARPSKLD